MNWLWDTATGEERQRLSHDHTVASIAFSPDSNTVAICDWKIVQLRDVETGEEWQARF